jgi:hypothetical protein
MVYHIIIVYFWPCIDTTPSKCSWSNKLLLCIFGRVLVLPLVSIHDLTHYYCVFLAVYYILNIIDLSRKTKMLWPRQENTIQKTTIWPWDQRSRSHEGHYGMRHTALWSCTHIPNKYYLKNNYLTLRSTVKVPRRSLWYIRWCVVYRNDLRGTLTFDLKVK